MKKIFLLPLFSVLYLMSFCQTVPYTYCNSCWDRDSLGNHRVVLSVSSNSKAVRTVIPWARMDAHPELKGMKIIDSTTGTEVQNISFTKFTRDTCIFYFEPVTHRGIYYVYYMPFKNSGSANYPKSVYMQASYSPDPEWTESLKDDDAIDIANVLRFEAVDSFNTFYPMEVKARDNEIIRLKKQNASKGFIVFPEDRLHSIRNKIFIPERWIHNFHREFKDTAARGENFAFQLGIYALKSLKNVRVEFNDLRSSEGLISKSNMFCLNTNGVSYDGKPFTKIVNVSADSIQPLWCNISVPKNTPPGIYRAFVKILTRNAPAQSIPIELRITNTKVAEGNAIQPWKITRLPWLNSTIAQKNTVIAPYSPLKVEGRVISLLGRKLEVALTGLPEKIETFFDERMTSYTTKPNKLLTRKVDFKVRSGGRLIDPVRLSFSIHQKDEGTVTWRSTSQYGSLKMIVNGSLEFDGFNSYSVRFIATKDISIDDIFMEIPIAKNFTKYLMGLGQKGGYRPDGFQWHWDVAHKNQDGAWIGNVNGGLQFSLRDQHYVRPLNTNFYLLKPLILPTSWGNNNKGGIKIFDNNNGTTTVFCYSGSRKMKKGDTLYYNFNLLITPFHTLNTDFQWETRFFHAYKPVQEVKDSGATIINIHHATAINPWINYPFIAWPKMKAYIDSAHAMGLKVKIYNTIRELSNHAYETYVLRSLGTEIYSAGKGGGYSWLQEHLDSNYIPAWFVPELKDAAIINSGMNRWHNYYVEGMNWLTQHVGIDGIYLDDVAFDRVTMKRIKRVLTREGHPGIIDLHSANQYNKNDGFNNSANLYMEHFPYLNRLWFGEYFDYEHNSPDFFLTEVSGIPFGLMGEMLQGGGNPWRGMVYGMTNRMPWSDNADPRPIWQLWDDFGIVGSQMIGYWVSDNPVRTDNSNVLATVYQKPGKALVAIGSWASEDTIIHLKIDWKQLGINPAKATITAPYVRNFQESKIFSASDAIPVKKNEGWMLVISEK